MISTYPPDGNAIAEVCAWALQTCMFAINLSRQGEPEPADPATYYEAMKAEADTVSRRLFKDMKAECPDDQPGEAMLNFIGKVFSWCAERRHEIS